jgi:hypothetical protein
MFATNDDKNFDVTRYLTIGYTTLTEPLFAFYDAHVLISPSTPAWPKKRRQTKSPYQSAMAPLPLSWVNGTLTALPTCSTP